MSHLRLATSDDAPDARPAADAGALRFASFAPMNDQPGLADRKASFVIGASGLLLSTTMFFVMPLGQFVRPGFWPPVVLGLALLLACASLWAVYTAYRCCMLPVPPAPGNLLFFQNVVACGREEYAEALAASDPDRALRDVLAYNHTMARLAVAKYRLVGRALLCLRVAIPLWIVLVLVLTVRGA
jgi:hypothetical protein